MTGNVNLFADNLDESSARHRRSRDRCYQRRFNAIDSRWTPRGEVAELKDNINTMIDNLRLTTDRNTEQDWLKTNLARFTGMFKGNATDYRR